MNTNKTEHNRDLPGGYRICEKHRRFFMLFLTRGHAVQLMAMTALVCAQSLSTAAPIDITISTDRPGAGISPSMWGIFFEDINFGADGGLYAELVKNRGFEFPNPLMGWSKAGDAPSGAELKVIEDEPFAAGNPHYLRLISPGAGVFGVSNEGFRGMGIRQGEEYDFSARVRVRSGTPGIGIELAGPQGAVLAHSVVSNVPVQWQKVVAVLRANATEPKAHLNLLLQGKGTVDVDMVSLFPRHTWKLRPGGLRADMVQKLADLKPGFMRFPGGCIVEGSELARRYQWKNTIGPVEDRKLLINRWNDEFKHRPAADYFQSFGLGFFEFFQLCEDIGAEPLPILNCGMACQFNSGELVSVNEMAPYIQDALDLIEFANGAPDHGWGARRAAMGHAAPFHLKMIGVGNEQWGQQYVQRYAVFARELKRRYPRLQLIAAAGPSPGDERFEYLWPQLRRLHADIVDEHCYANPIWFFSNSPRYDNYDRKGPKVFMGEYAAQSVAVVSQDNRNNLECALAEAAYMTGLERNAAVVRMASYAPLFAHANAWQWTPDLIWADSLRVFGTPSYFVQQTFMRNRGDSVLPVSLNAPVVMLPPAGKIGLGTSDTTAEFRDLKVISGGRVLFAPDFAGTSSAWSGGSSWTAREGQYRQDESKGRLVSLAGEEEWSDYTLTLKARRLSGSDTLMIIIRAHSPQEYSAWNLGGWQNAFHGIISHLGGQDQLIARAPGALETGRWYDVKVQLKGTRIDCYLDGRLVQRAIVPVRRTPDFFASAVRENQTGDTILKAVNPTSRAVSARINLAGCKETSLLVSPTILTGSSSADENSFEAPEKIALVSESKQIMPPQFSFGFKPYSLTVLRISKSP
jgi:alpha-L-arabinofuranosidase